MLRTPKLILGLAAGLLGSVALAQSTPNANLPPQASSNRADHATLPPLRDVKPLPEQEGHRDKPIRLLNNPDAALARPDGASQTVAVEAAATVGNVVSFDGLGVGGGYTPNAAPPDTNGAIGDTQYVQWVNESFAVYDKVSGARLYGPAAGNTLFQPLGANHPCAKNNDGDPIAQYDKAAHRWVMTQFSVTSGGSVGYWQCVAVSKTSDAISGGWNVYAFNYGTTDFNDYPKLGVWSDNYYISFNIFLNGSSFKGSKICAYDRAAMLAGTAATQVCFQLSSSFGGLLPADLDGSTPPPAGSPEYFMAFGTNVLQLWKMSNVNFTAGTATLTGPTNLNVASFSEACGGGACVPQAGTTQKLDSLGDRLMYRLAYRNFGDHEALVVNHAVTAGTSVGERWYEVRSPNAAPTVFQQGTYTPDAAYRWMGSAAMDNVGNLALGYSVSSSSINPGIRFAARAPGDPLNLLGTEVTIKDGTGSQNGGLNRWGDYSSLTVDPADDCTMWYTTEYLQANGSFNWSTRIGYFKFTTCGSAPQPDFSLAAAPSSQTVLQGNGTSYTATVTPSNGFNGTVNFSVSGLPSGASGNFVPTSVNGSGNSTLSITTSASTPAGSYPLTITGTSGSLVHTTSVTLVVTSVNPPDFSIAATPSSRSIARGASTTYTVAITGVNGFSGSTNLSVSGVPSKAQASFSPASIGGSGSSTLTISSKRPSPAGTFTLTITGTSGSLSHSTTVTLTLN
jgi:hypothetical protein